MTADLDNPKNKGETSDAFVSCAKMRTHDRMMDYAGRSLDAPRERLLLGRIGAELALVYHDVLQSPLPPRLRELVERLDEESLANETRRADA